jgi:hypothetical protein
MIAVATPAGAVSHKAVDWNAIDFPFTRFKPPSLDGQISSPLFLVHCPDVVRRESRWQLAQIERCRFTPC